MTGWDIVRIAVLAALLLCVAGLIVGLTWPPSLGGRPEPRPEWTDADLTAHRDALHDARATGTVPHGPGLTDTDLDTVHTRAQEARRA